MRMGVDHLEIMVEELSMEAFLRILLPRMLGDVSFEVYPHQGKPDLLARLPERLRGYSRWLPSTWRIIVVVDRDNDECHDLKASLECAARGAGLTTRSRAKGRPYAVVNRVAIEELEAWYFGDWPAVRQAYPRVPEGIPGKAKYRDPDSISGGTWEAFERVLQQAGYFKGGLRKIEAARTIARHVDPERNSSRSFRALCSALRDVSSGA